MTVRTLADFLTESPRRVTATGPCRRPGSALRAAFTLIELMVVIVIIGILVGITLPALSKARETSKRLKCLTNLKGFGMAFELYRNANKDLLPYVLPFHNASFPQNPSDPQLLDVMEGYMDSKTPYYNEAGELVVTEPFLCPSDTDNVGLETGFSYEYWPGVLMVAREIFRGDRNPAGTVSRFYEFNPNFPVLADANPWHPGRPRTYRANEDGSLTQTAYDQNGLYFGDWRADWLNMDPQGFVDGPP
ncbi:MAG: prepilin-type N-terminal cleavage/methylation domain-containing protein [Pyrinomonadaceae bacterium]|nr:prepilin-type N-terminal cleavage/methylation domain-containing protein [Phycisphaerales bacterium]